MPISLIGSSLENPEPRIKEKCILIGRALAKHKITLLTGSCWGYPYEANKACYRAKGKTIGISPASNKKEHIETYNFPTEPFTEIIYTGKGIPGRNIPLINSSDAVIMVSGQIGTLNEFTLAYHAKKPIAVLKGSGGITEIIPKIADICNKVGEKDRVIYESDPEKLVEKIKGVSSKT